MGEGGSWGRPEPLLPPKGCSGSGGTTRAAFPLLGTMKSFLIPMFFLIFAVFLFFQGEAGKRRGCVVVVIFWLLLWRGSCSRRGQESPADNSDSPPVPFIPSCRGWGKGTKIELFPTPFPSGHGGRGRTFFPEVSLTDFSVPPRVFDPLLVTRAGGDRWDFWEPSSCWGWDFRGSEDHPGCVPFPNRRRFGFRAALEFQTTKLPNPGEKRDEKGKEPPSSKISPCSSHKSLESHPPGSAKSQIIAGS